ncbi:hypothetical protein M8J76_006483 [Diaphorina citri]|nr:hypothetical protein M8J76_006483 [Diaphorina citri]
MNPETSVDLLDENYIHFRKTHPEIFGQLSLKYTVQICLQNLFPGVLPDRDSFSTVLGLAPSAWFPK